MNENLKNRVHVLHVVPGLAPAGTELTMARVITALTTDRMRHSVICLKGAPEIADQIPPSTDIHCLHSAPNELRLPARLTRLIRQIRPTVIHARNWGAWADIAFARLFARPVVPLILSFHGLGRAGYMPLRRRLTSRVLARMATGLLTLSNCAKELMVAKWGWPRHKIDVIPNGVDTNRFCPIPRDRVGTRTVVGTVAALVPKKNHALLIRACGELVGRGLDVELRVAGKGPERQDMVAVAESTGLTDRFRLFGHVKEVPGFLRELDIFVLSSNVEGHSNALNEAMACGLACVSTRAGCAQEQLDYGRCGVTVCPRNMSELTAALENLINNPDLRQRLGVAARQRACRHYSREKMMAAYADLYRRCSRNGNPHT